MRPPQKTNELTEGPILANVLKLAARQIKAEKRHEIRKWVLGNSG